MMHLLKLSMSTISSELRTATRFPSYFTWKDLDPEVVIFSHALGNPPDLPFFTTRSRSIDTSPSLVQTAIHFFSLPKRVEVPTTMALYILETFIPS